MTLANAKSIFHFTTSPLGVLLQISQKSQPPQEQFEFNKKEFHGSEFDKKFSGQIRHVFCETLTIFGIRLQIWNMKWDLTKTILDW